MNALANPHLGSAWARWGNADAPVAVLGLHGRGQSPDTIAELHARLGDESAYWLAPAAINAEWYPYRFMDLPPDGDRWLSWSLDAVEAGLAELRQAGFTAERTVLLGFSQGACLAAHYALTHPRRYAGIAVLTGGYVGPDGSEAWSDGGFDGTPALITTVEHDQWVPVIRVRQTETQLRAMGAQVTSLVEPGDGHAVSDSAIWLLRRLLTKVNGVP